MAPHLLVPAFCSEQNKISVLNLSSLTLVPTSANIFFWSFVADWLAIAFAHSDTPVWTYGRLQHIRRFCQKIANWHLRILKRIQIDVQRMVRERARWSQNYVKWNDYCIKCDGAIYLTPHIKINVDWSGYRSYSRGSKPALASFDCWNIPCDKEDCTFAFSLFLHSFSFSAVAGDGTYHGTRAAGDGSWSTGPYTADRPRADGIQTRYEYNFDIIWKLCGRYRYSDSECQKIALITAPRFYSLTHCAPGRVISLHTENDYFTTLTKSWRVMTLTVGLLWSCQLNPESHVEILQFN